MNRAPSRSSGGVQTGPTLHQGSRVHHGRERAVFMGVLQRFDLVHETPFNWIDPSRFPEGSAQSLALMPPRPVMRNYYFPDPLAEYSATVRRGVGIDIDQVNSKRATAA